MNWHVFADGEALSKACAQRIAECIAQTLQRQAHCHVALPGGSTPAATFKVLASSELPWDKVFWLPGDERCLPVGDAERNDLMIRQNLCRLLPNGDQNLIAIPAEMGPARGAARFAEQLQHIGPMDVALLGMGEDGHTASLFPGNDALRDEAAAVAVFDSPKPPPKRVSMGLGYLNRSRHRIVLAAGAGKQPVIRQIQQGVRFPVSLLLDAEYYLDVAAAGERA
jgi:6-phosphogluconolactonase